LEKYPYLADLDLKQHWREWQQVALPIFVIVAAGLLVAFLMLRNRGNLRELAVSSDAPARIDLLLAVAPGNGFSPPFDPAFLVASPLEMARAPVAHRFDAPEAPPVDDPQDSDFDAAPVRVFAAADGLVLFAGAAPAVAEEPAPDTPARRLLVLLHQLPEGGFVQTRYSGLASLAVPVGRQVRRGDAVGTFADSDSSQSRQASPEGADAADREADVDPLPREARGWDFEIRPGTAFGAPTPPSRRDAVRLATDRFLREHGSEPGTPRLPPVRGEALESGILRLERLEAQ